MYDYAKAARAAAENHPHITADALRRCEEDGLTVQQAADELGVARSTVMKLRCHYGLVKPRAKRPGAPVAAGPIPPPPPAAEPPAAVLSTLSVAPFELHQSGHFNAAKLAWTLAGIVALFEHQEGEFEVELVIRQAVGEVEEAKKAAEAAAIIVTHQLLSAGEIAAAAVARTAGLLPPEGGDDAP